MNTQSAVPALELILRADERLDFLSLGTIGFVRVIVAVIYTVAVE